MARKVTGMHLGGALAVTAFLGITMYFYVLKPRIHRQRIVRELEEVSILFDSRSQK